MIVQTNLPDIVVNQFLTRLTREDRDLYRHKPEGDNEIQYFALKPDADPGNVHADDILAYMHFTWTADEELTAGIAIAPEARGTGIGKEMYGMMTQITRDAGAKKLRAEVFPHNHSAVKRQLEIGFKFYGPVYLTEIDLEEK